MLGLQGKIWDGCACSQQAWSPGKSPEAESQKTLLMQRVPKFFENDKFARLRWRMLEDGVASVFLEALVASVAFILWGLAASLGQFDRGSKLPRLESSRALGHINNGSINQTPIVCRWLKAVFYTWHVEEHGITDSVPAPEQPLPFRKHKQALFRAKCRRIILWTHQDILHLELPSPLLLWCLSGLMQPALRLHCL